MSMNRKRQDADYHRDPDPVFLVGLQPGGLIANVRVRHWMGTHFTCQVKAASSKKPYKREMR